MREAPMHGQKSTIYISYFHADKCHKQMAKVIDMVVTDDNKNKRESYTRVFTEMSVMMDEWAEETFGVSATIQERHDCRIELGKRNDELRKYLGLKPL